jgi:hypothetical protein
MSLSSDEIFIEVLSEIMVLKKPLNPLKPISVPFCYLSSLLVNLSRSLKVILESFRLPLDFEV